MTSILFLVEQFKSTESDAGFSKTKYLFLIFSAFFKCTSNFEHSQKKMTLIAYVFWNLGAAKYALR